MYILEITQKLKSLIRIRYFKKNPILACLILWFFKLKVFADSLYGKDKMATFISLGHSIMIKDLNISEIIKSYI